MKARLDLLKLRKCECMFDLLLQVWVLAIRRSTRSYSATVIVMERYTLMTTFIASPVSAPCSVRNYSLLLTHIVSAVVAAYVVVYIPVTRGWFDDTYRYDVSYMWTAKYKLSSLATTSTSPLAAKKLMNDFSGPCLTLPLVFCPYCLYPEMALLLLESDLTSNLPWTSY